MGKIRGNGVRMGKKKWNNENKNDKKKTKNTRIFRRQTCNKPYGRERTRRKGTRQKGTGTKLTMRRR